ncbi:hypothetical protein ORI89_17925 [Sphingobacterium sp. UT-1RO-CII-1]|uniref:TlpA family protein disulfide reductase n=1 Tax=Sphingobacterium sp. UT-1RO-CII-1 TaxID=2995225 RepID=UPI00227C43F7|nr:hypothetical protein [Sphingobacterium sp. UT-1RO-CII-1]MCY4781539.1 hypothetical protein [Sphingobacterium sp. UT-1RO-CII-1]
MMRFLRKGDRYALNKPLEKYSDPSLSGFRCLILSFLGKFYYQFSCNVQESRARGTTGYFLDRDNREKGVVKERLLRIARSDGRSNAAVLLTIFCVLFSFASIMEAQAQEPRQSGATSQEEVRIGRGVPVNFWTKEHLFYVNGDTVRKTLEEHKGKMLVMDFWFSGCSRCLLHQKDIRTFIDEYADDLVVVMVNSKKTREDFDKINTLYQKGFFKKFGIEHFETIIEDDYLASILPSTSYPHYAWINSLGVLQLRTFRNLLDRNYVAPFIDGK